MMFDHQHLGTESEKLCLQVLHFYKSYHTKIIANQKLEYRKILLKYTKLSTLEHQNAKYVCKIELEFIVAAKINLCVTNIMEFIHSQVKDSPLFYLQTLVIRNQLN